ncbi:YaaA family protein [Demequina sp.]|uniref:YaaA family protein n=1 Tax=Demequina sp. TaxID=2050685 RepID=UPI003D0E4C05
MLILLPPSEGKTAPVDGDPLDLESLSHPELNRARQRVARDLIAASGRRNALQILGVGASIAPQVANNNTLWSNPTAPAAQVYTGVLYDAAASSTWDDATLARARDRIRIISGLWGALSPADLIPAYRLNMCVHLPRVGALTAIWRANLPAALDPLAHDQLIVDCRSSDYAAVWKAPAGGLTVRVAYLQDGKRKIASHTAKHTRGLLTGALVAAPTDPTAPEELAQIASTLPNVTDVELDKGALTLLTS